MCRISFFEEEGNKVRDHSHTTNKIREAAQTHCTLNLKQRDLTFASLFLHNVTKNDPTLFIRDVNNREILMKLLIPPQKLKKDS